MNPLSLFLVFLISLEIISACSATQNTNAMVEGVDYKDTSKAVDELEEYKVYSALIESWYVQKGAKMIVIKDHTTSPPRWFPVKGSSPPWISLKGSITIVNATQVSSAAVNDLMEKGQNETTLKRMFELSVNYTLLTEDELKHILRGDRGGWDRFYAQYSESQGILTLSRVGFNENMTQALLYVSNQVHWGVEGHYVVMTRRDGNWTVEDSEMVLIS